MRLVLLTALVILHFYVLLDVLVGTKGRTPGKLPRFVWAIITLLPLIGPVVWLTLKWMLWAEIRRLNLRRAKFGQKRRGPLPPDEDPAFLHRLETELRRQNLQHPTDKNNQSGETTENIPTAEHKQNSKEPETATSPNSHEDAAKPQRDQNDTPDADPNTAGQ